MKYKEYKIDRVKEHNINVYPQYVCYEAGKIIIVLNENLLKKGDKVKVTFDNNKEIKNLWINEKLSKKKEKIFWIK
jgi:hypothetical protein